MTKKGTASHTPTGPVDAFWAVSNAGKELARLHIEYESLEPWPLKFIETTAVTPASRRHPGDRRDGGATGGASSPRHGGVKPPLRTGMPWHALTDLAAGAPRADLKVGATIPLSYRVEGRRGREKGSEFNFFTCSRIPQRL